MSFHFHTPRRREPNGRGPGWLGAGPPARLAALGWLALVASAAAAPRPHVLLIVADDLGAHDLACTGSDLHDTPVLDGLAARGLLFTRASAPAPVCSPTRAALLTGLHPARLGITIWSEGARNPDRSRRLLPGESLDHLPWRYETLAEKLAAAGYRTAIVGKWHLGDGDFAAETQGFEVAVGGTRWGAPPTFFWPYRNDTRFRGEFRYVPGLPFGRPGDYLTDTVTDAALRVIDDAGDAPLFLYLAHYAPHTPIEAPPHLVDKYSARLRPGMRHRNPTYAGMIESLDANVGRVLEHLDRTGRLDDTLVIFTSDNGGFLGSPGGRNGEVTTNAPLRSGKGSLYEGGLRVPLIMKLPRGSAAGHRMIDERVVLTDLYRVILSLCGLPPAAPDAVEDAVDWSANLLDAAQPWPARGFHFHYPHYYETTTPASAIIEDDMKLIQYAEDDRSELYDLAADPGEARDLAAAEPARAAALRDRLARWKAEVGAKEAVPNPDHAGR